MNRRLVTGVPAACLVLLAALVLGACAEGATGGNHGDSSVDVPGDGKDGGGKPGDKRDSGTTPAGKPDAGKPMDGSIDGDASDMLSDGSMADVVVHDDAAIAASMDASTCATAGTCDFAYTPTNFDPSKVDPGAADAITTLSCPVTFDSSGAAPTFPVCGAGAKPTVTIGTLMGGGEVAIVAMRDFVIPAGGSLTLTGSRPVILSVFGNATIGGIVNASASKTKPGAGGSIDCSGGIGSDGNDSDSSNKTAGSGGGGGGFGTVGGGGGAGTGNCCAGVAGSMTEGDAMLDPLRGGCSGGRGGRGGQNGTTDSALGGAGGGAVQISASGTVAISGTIAAAGGGGTHGAAECDGGGGGGSGGSIVLEGDDIHIAVGAWVTANGGGGAAGNPRLNSNGDDGGNGAASAATVAVGGAGDNSSGDGGNGATGTAGALVGKDATGLDGRGGGGGGGGVGRIRITADGTCTKLGVTSPAASGC